MAFDNIHLEKGMYHEAGRSFTQVLEQLDPSEGYRGTPLENTDAFQRQLKRFGIRVKGAGSDTVEKFFSTFESAVLFPEFLARAVRQGMDEANILPAITATVTRIDAMDYRSIYSIPTDADKEYLKYQNMIVRKSEDHVGEEAGQIKGNLRSRTETGIEVLGDEIYLFCQGSKNSGKDYPDVPSAVLRISGNSIQNGKPVAIDDDYYVNLTEVTGRYMWKCFYIGGNKFCLQLYTEKGTAGFVEGSHKAFGIFDVKTEQYTPVTGLPDANLIYDIALAYAADTDNNTITFEVETTDSQLPALYTIGKDGVAKRGMEVDTESIKGVSLLKQK